jgi:uncharacterized membrane protein (DUF373 family)
MKQLLPRWGTLAERWPELTIYQRFESLIAFALSLIIGLVILVALFRLVVDVVGSLVLGAANPLDHKIFQRVFGEIMTLLIALEFNHTLHYFAIREKSIIQTKVVLLISLLALARKFIILDMHETSANQLFGLAAVTLALGISCWLVSAPGYGLRPGQLPRRGPTGKRPV